VRFEVDILILMIFKHIHMFSCVCMYSTIKPFFLHHKDLLEDEEREMGKYNVFPRSTDDFVYSTYHDLKSVSFLCFSDFHYLLYIFNNFTHKKNLQ